MERFSMCVSQSPVQNHQIYFIPKLHFLHCFCHESPREKSTLVWSVSAVVAAQPAGVCDCLQYPQVSQRLLDTVMTAVVGD